MEWTEYKLKDVCLKITDGSHSSPQAQTSGYPMFSVKDMLEYGFDYSKCKYISEEDFRLLKANDCVPQKGDVLVAKDGSYLKEIFVCKETKEEGILSSIAIFRPNTNTISSEFLCYLLKSPDVFDYISNNCVSGSALPRIVLKDFKEVKLRIPSLKIQNRIASILSSLDAQIENNNRINRNLEEQAQALFKSWFVDFEPWGGKMPEDWKEGKLGEIANITMGQSPAGVTLNTEGNGVIFYQGCSDFGFRFPSVRVFTTAPTRYAESNSVLFSVRAPVGAVNIALKSCSIGRGLASIKAKGNYQSFILYLIKSLKEQFDSFNGEGSVFGCINKKSLEGMSVICPSLQTLCAFESKISAIDAQIKNNHEESIRLAALRDTLLPKLMKGEIEI